MKTDTVIRQHIADLEWANEQACTCTTPEEREQCRIGRMLIVAAIGVLRWVIGEHPGYDKVVRELHRHNLTGQSLPCGAPSSPRR